MAFEPLNSTIQTARPLQAHRDHRCFSQPKKEKKGFSTFSIQPKLTGGSPDDPYEREADLVADRVMRMSEPGFVQRKCAECEKEEKEVQRKPLNHVVTPFLQAKSEVTVNDGVANAIQSSRGGGSALDTDTHAFMSSRFGGDFKGVKIHTDHRAIQLNRQLNAKAFTVGNDIYFNRGQYRPGSSEGKHLLAHELTHVVQQVPAELVQKTDWPIIGGSCCNKSENNEWALVGEGIWQQLGPDSCTDFFEDCDGMTCGGGFYSNHGWRSSSKFIGSSACKSLRNDGPYYRARRWTPTNAGSEALSPTQRGSTEGDIPPGYAYDP